MANPKRRRSSARQGNVRSHDHQLLYWQLRNIRKQDKCLELNFLPGFSKCLRCGQPKLPHRICHNCGYYIIDKKKKEPTEVIELF
ncbi:MAG: 50S ribosomal protein L32 [Planctomycetota bacterium]